METIETYIENLDEYSKMLLRLREEKSSLKIKNDSLDHAKILVTNLFAHAKNEILIYTSSLCSLFYLSEELKASYEEIKNKDISIKILIQYKFTKEEDKKIGQHASKEKMEELFGDKIEIKFLEDTSDKNKITYNFENDLIVINNFTVVDGISFRYERQETEKGFCGQSIEQKFTKAFGCMKDEQTAKLLREVFYENFENHHLFTDS